MTNRERAMNVLHYRRTDRLPAVHFGYWGELLQEWRHVEKFRLLVLLLYLHVAEHMIK